MTIRKTTILSNQTLVWCFLSSRATGRGWRGFLMGCLAALTPKPVMFLNWCVSKTESWKANHSDVSTNNRYLFIFFLQMKDMRHENVNPFLGFFHDCGVFAIVTEFCSRGSLEDLLVNDDVKLDWMFKSSLLLDLIKVNNTASTYCSLCNFTCSIKLEVGTISLFHQV